MRSPAWSVVCVEPIETHTHSIVMLHGFTQSADQYARWWIRQLRNHPGMEGILAGLRLLFVQSPTREISCYGEPKPKLTAWHDYLTDHGGNGRPDVEEEIDACQLGESRARIHCIIDEEIERLGGDASRVAVGGQSQGGCTALDAALTHPSMLGGVWASFGHLYSCTPTEPAKQKLRVWAFHGAADTVIAPSLTSRAFARLLDAGFTTACLHVAPSLAHCQPSTAEVEFFRRALEDFGFMRPEGRRSPTARDEPLQKRQALLIRARC